MKKNPVLSHVVGVLLACLACLHASAREASGQLAVSAWPTFQHDLRHTGQSTVNGPASANNLKWLYQGSGPLKSAPAIGAMNIGGIDQGSSLIPAPSGEYPSAV